MTKPARSWDPNLYDQQHSFVWELAGEILSWLDPKPGESILDLGSGTGHLTARIADLGALVVGIDSSPEMVGSARGTYPNLDFRLGDARSFELDREVDAVFSNATLHWVREADQVATRVFAALRSGGRFVAEFGGAGNVTEIMAAARSVLEPRGLFSWPSQYYPTPEEYSDVLTAAGLEVRRIEVVPRLTALPGGLRSWLRMFRGELLAQIPPAELETTLEAIEDAARPKLHRNETWFADYVRLRVEASKP